MAPRRAAGAKAAADKPQGAQRRCLASGRVLPKAELLRFVVGPEGQIVPDFAERLPGRGLWLLARRDMMEKACKKNLFAKAAKAQVRLPSDLVEQVEQLALRRCLDQLGLARRAGAVVVGFEKVKAALKADRVGLLLQASDAAQDGREKLRALARAVGWETSLLQFCDGVTLGTALGRDAAVHVGVTRGRFSAGLKRDVERLAGLRGVEDQGNGVGRPTEGER
ncbi:RNA-binding protein [Pelagibius litoralis]|uniref:RNA-binding protein n=2 Tax=Pelagibius litoralis TaxID=374515 RepID=A0A967KID0_9PROT|nr:RNA-binding protein [Pelagibius litoralis]